MQMRSISEQLAQKINAFMGVKGHAHHIHVDVLDLNFASPFPGLLKNLTNFYKMTETGTAPY